MRKFILPLLALVLLLWSCSKSSGQQPDPEPKPEPETPSVLESKPMAWDGEKRGRVFYEIFVRSFADSNGDGIGDLNGITAKLDYLNSLGINGIWLTPINPSPSYHGYDVTDYRAVNPEYGTIDDLRILIAKARSLNIKVVLDFVINHTSSQHPWFAQAIASAEAPQRDYYLIAPRDKVQQMCQEGAFEMIEDRKYNPSMWHTTTGGQCYYGMFSPVMPDLNYASKDLMAEMVSAATFWMELGVDGFRLDAVKHLYQDEHSSQNVALLKRFYDALRSRYPSIYMVGEVLASTDVVAPYFGGLPSVFNFESWWKMEWALNNATGKWYAKDMNDCNQKFQTVRVDYNSCTKLSNHDEDRTRTVLQSSIEKARMAIIALMTMPGQPYIYYGEEIGMLGLKAQGDEGVREPIPWGDNYTTTWHTPRYSTLIRCQPLRPAAKTPIRYGTPMLG